MVLPAIEAATAVRNGKASTIYPAVYHDLVHWCSAQGSCRLPVLKARLRHWPGDGQSRS